MNVKMNSGLLAIFLATSVALSAAAFNQSNDGVQPPASDIRCLTEALSGRWSLNVKWEPDAENPNGLVNTGEETWRSGPGGYTLIEEEQIRFPKKTANAYLLGIIWPNPRASHRWRILARIPIPLFRSWPQGTTSLSTILAVPSGRCGVPITRRRGACTPRLPQFAILLSVPKLTKPRRTY